MIGRGLFSSLWVRNLGVGRIGLVLEQQQVAMGKGVMLCESSKATAQINMIPFSTMPNPTFRHNELSNIRKFPSTVFPAAIITSIEVDNVFFSPTVIPPASNKQLFLAGAGVRGIEMGGKFVKFTAIGVYLEEEAVVPCLAGRWKGKTADEMADSVDFFREIVTGPFEKFIKVTMILPLTGQQYSEKVAENCVAVWKSLGIYSEAEAKAIEQFLHIFKDQQFPPATSILFTLLRNGSLAITFWKDGPIPETENGIIENELLSEAVLESIIGKKGVSPQARSSIASRLAQVFVHSATG